MTESDAARTLRLNDPVYHRLQIQALTDALRETTAACSLLLALTDPETSSDPMMVNDLRGKARDQIFKAFDCIAEVNSND